MVFCVTARKTEANCNEISRCVANIDVNLFLNRNVSSTALERYCQLVICITLRFNLALILALQSYYTVLLMLSSSVCYVKDINAIEAVQRRLTKRIPSMTNLTYCQRLRELGIESLQLRRLRADLLLTYKLVFDLLDMDVSEFFYYTV